MHDAQHLDEEDDEPPGGRETSPTLRPVHEHKETVDFEKFCEAQRWGCEDGRSYLPQIDELSNKGKVELEKLWWCLILLHALVIVGWY